MMAHLVARLGPGAVLQNSQAFIVREHKIAWSSIEDDVQAVE